MRRIKLWGAVHVDELEALQFVQSVIDDPIPNVSAELADTDNLGPDGSRSELCCALPGNWRSVKHQKTAESLKRRGRKMVAASLGYYATIDTHNVLFLGENHACISAEQGVSPMVLGMLAGLGIKHIVDTGGHGVPGSIPNGLVLETVSSGLGRDHQALRAAFYDLANNPNPPTADVVGFKWFKVVGPLRDDRVDPRSLRGYVRANLQGFEPFPPDIAARLGYEGVPVCPTTFRYEPRANGVWGEFAEQIPVPDSSLWPQ